MVKINIYHIVNNFVFTHIIFIIIYAIIYYYYFSNMDYHYNLNNNISKKEYEENKLINSLFLSVNLETTTGYLDFHAKSSIAKLTVLSQLIISIIISLEAIYFYIT